MNHAALLTPDAFDVQVRELGLVSHESEHGFDNLTALAARLLKVPTALVTIVQRSQNRQFFKSAVGLPELVRDLRQTPLSHSFCQYVQASGQPLVIENATRDARVSDNAAVHDLNVVAYLGVPIHLDDGTTLGAFCAVDSVPRDWTNDDLVTMQQLARSIDEIILLRQACERAETLAEQARDEAEARKRFLAHMSHEIRTPLNGIIGSVDLMMRAATSITPPTPRETGELLRTVNRSAHSLERLLNDALDIAKIDAGKLELALAPFDLREMVADVVKLFSASAEKKGIDIVMTFTDVPLKQLRMGDGFRLRQVVSNLLSNAVKFTDVGEVCVCVRGSDLGLQIEVRDSGCGIPQDKIATLFDPFTQAEATTSHKKGGTGLGMAIVKQMVELMGGRIRAESAPGQGSSFRVSLPMRIVSPEEAALEDHDHVIEASMPLPLLGCRVLVADDSPANRLVLQKMLETLGAIVDKAYDGGDAFGRAVTTRYDVLLLDIQMPGYDGVEVVKRLRRNPRHVAQDALCIAVTGNVQSEQVETYLDAGFDAWLAKPLRQSDLLRVLSPLVEHRALKS